MFDFPKKKDKEQAAGDKPDGKAFLENAQRDHEALFADFLKRVEAEEFDDFATFYAALHEASWELMDDRCRQSFRNGKLLAGSSRKR